MISSRNRKVTQREEAVAAGEMVVVKEGMVVAVEEAIIEIRDKIIGIRTKIIRDRERRKVKDLNTSNARDQLILGSSTITLQVMIQMKLQEETEGVEAVVLQKTKVLGGQIIKKKMTTTLQKLQILTELAETIHLIKKNKVKEEDLEAVGEETTVEEEEVTLVAVEEQTIEEEAMTPTIKKIEPRGRTQLDLNAHLLFKF